MSATCDATIDRLAHQLGSFSCASVRPVIHLRNPAHLSNWTLPTLEALMIVGAALALVHAIARLRRAGDPTNLALWCASIVYLLVTEPPLYFPKVFGLPDDLGGVFAHNVFTVQFMYDRLPLYIVALYPALACLAYEIVRLLGGFRRHVVVGAVCVGFVHHLFYEIFDQLGPQLKWWIWNPDAKTNRPALASVPMTSVFIFATLGPAALVLLVRLLVGRRVDRGRAPGGWGLAARTVLAGVLVPVLVTLGSLPESVFGGDHPHHTAQAVVLMAGVGLFAAVAVPVLVREWLRSRSGQTPAATAPSWLAVRFGPLYLVVMGVLWITALPAYFGAEHGVTTGGTPTGNLAYTAACLVLASLALVGAATTRGAFPGRAARPAPTGTFVPSSG